MRIVAIPFYKEGYLNFWNIVKMDDSLYTEAYRLNHNIVRIDGRTKEQADILLRAEKKRLKLEQNLFAKARASIKIFNSEKQYYKDLAFARNISATITL